MRETLIIGRLFTAGKTGMTEAALRKDLLPIFTRVMDTTAAERALSATLEQAISGENASRTQRGKSVKFALTDRGRSLANRLFPKTAKPTWASLKKTWLAAYALGMQDELSPSEVKQLSKATVLRMILINQRFQLGLPAIPNPKDFETALLWHAARQGLSDAVYDWARRRSPTVGVILAALTASIGQVPPTAQKQSVFSHLAGKIAGGSDLHAALLVRLLTPASIVGASAGRSSPTENPTPTTSTVAQKPFAAWVLEAARRSPTGKVGEGLVLLNHVFHQFQSEHPGEVSSLASFKARLMEAAIDGRLQLASADMPQTLDQRDYEASRIDRGASTYALLRIQ